MLAQQIFPDFIVLDDRRARQIAKARRLNVIGTLGVLGDAARYGLIDLHQASEDLLKTNFRASPTLLRQILDRLSR